MNSIVQHSDGISVITRSGGDLRVIVCSPDIIHVIYSPKANSPSHPDYVVIKGSWPPAGWALRRSADTISLSTAKLTINIARATSAATFTDSSGKQLFQDTKRLMKPAIVNGERTYHGELVSAMYGSQEALYGLGQHQAGVWNYRGESVDVSQENTNIAIPLLLSSGGYGIFWNNDSRTRFNNRFIHSLYISSEVADSIDYYFLYGPDFDHIIASYRELTGAAPMFGLWAYGFWQSKNRYRSQAEILSVAHAYRAKQIPIDNIVQDWFWWTLKGQHQFNANYPDPKGMIDDLHRDRFHFMISVWPFFEPGSEEYAYMSQRGWFIDKTRFENAPYHHNGMALYDATNPEARRYYWKLMNDHLFNIGVDAWWLDTTEPETEGQEENILLGHKLYIGSGDRYANIYPLMTTAAVYEGQRAASDRKRVFILSRSAFSGAQRNAVAAWSGDVLENWETFKRQIPAGLNYSLSGMPYWTTDIGGFISGGNLDDPKYRELFVRWFEYGTFCPIFRTHGTRDPDTNELWSYGTDAQSILVNYDRLRYRLMPYIYSLAWMTTHDGYTPMRPLAMDYRDDVKAQNTGDEFMYGPAFLVAPVTEQGAAERRVYLPGEKWFDFWSGKRLSGGSTFDAPAPLDRMPVYIRAGSIVPFGADEQYAAERSGAPIELRIYPGANGAFTLYDDEGDNYDYEKGAYATVPITWNDAAQTLTIGERRGSYPGMPRERTFAIILVSERHGVGIAPTQNIDETVTYTGAAVTLRLHPAQ